MRRHLIVVSLSLLLLGAITTRVGGLASAQVASQAAAPQAVPPPQAPGQWDVADCKTCHDTAVGPAFEHSKHAGLEQNCASCHANVAEHSRKQMAGDESTLPSLKKQSAKDVNAMCLTCHEKNNHTSFLSSMHARRNVSCVSCHSVHNFKSVKAQLKTAQDPETCYTCHKSYRAKAMRTSHHPVREGKMTCSSCHNPHDGTNPKMVSANSINEKCYQCHTEKRGPFLYEHAPVREECVSCHDPHGSNHERLLVAKQPYLCQRCHFSGHGLTADNASSLEGLPVAPPGSTATRSSRNTERGCKQCHFAIHGSNSPSGAFFVR
jgi:DmsE family decaheme c-type cytochrome